MIPEPARTAGWTELLAHPEVVERSVPGSPVGLMAFHGGLEGGTLEIAEAVAGACGASLYTVRQPPELRWHVPSNAVDPATSPALAEWLTHVDVAIALHGYGRVGRPRQILLGGTNRRLAGLMADALGARLDGFGIVNDIDLIPAELRGLHPANPVNRPAAGGVQLELPPSARGASPRPAGTGDAPALVVEALVAAIAQWESTAARDAGLARPLASDDTPSGRNDT